MKIRTFSHPLSEYAGAILLVVLASLVCETVRSVLAPTNMVMVYLLAVVLAATRLGLRSAIATAFLAVVAFDVFFVPPRFSLRVSDTEYLITFLALFVVGVVISTLVARIREKVEQIRSQEARTSSLFYLTRDLTAAADVPAVVAALERAVHRHFESSLAVMLNKDGNLERVEGGEGVPGDPSCKEIALWALKSGRRAGAGAAAFSESPYVFIPIKSVGGVEGVMVLENGGIFRNEDLQLLEAFAGQAAMAVARVHLSRQAEEARILREKTNLEQALLNSISHDLRTPLVTISGVLDSMLADEKEYDARQKRTMILAASQEASRLNRFVSSLLDMTRLEAGALSPRLMLCEVEEVVGCAVAAIRSRLGANNIITDVEPCLPPVSVDLALLTQALVNLLDNALKFSPPSADIGLSARLEGSRIAMEVTDCGPGVPPGEEKRIFDKFHRVKVPEATGGTGLGLSIAKGIIDAHKGIITASNRPQGGLMVKVLLPVEAAAAEGDSL